MISISFAGRARRIASMGTELPAGDGAGILITSQQCARFRVTAA
jgi:hypothetical protein